MFSTKIGHLDGDTWERIMQICFRMKYEAENYQEIPASPGDFGIEGFTKTGKAFQCYCPDSELTFDELYTHQRDKITKDLNKLKLYETSLQDYLKGVKIKEWIFVTPKFTKKDLIKHCAEKTEEIRRLNLSIIDPDCVVVIHDIDNFIKEIPHAINGEGRKLHLMAEADEVSLHNINTWKEKSIPYVDNVIRKHTKRFQPGALKVDEKVDELTTSTIKDYLEGEAILKQWQQMHPEAYDKFLIFASQVEAEVKEKCMFGAADNNKLYNEIRGTVESKLKTQFKYLDDLMIVVLAKRTIAYWLLRCPLDFE